VEDPIVLNWLSNEGEEAKIGSSSIVVMGRRVCNFDESHFND
jgi:hypothetical protein